MICNSRLLELIGIDSAVHTCGTERLANGVSGQTYIPNALV